MRVASLRSGRDGRLVVVNAALTRAVAVDDVAPTLQAALDDWEKLEPLLAERAARLEWDEAPGAFALDPVALAAPLPRAYQWLDGSAYLRHVELARRARGAELPPNLHSDPLMYQGGSDFLLGPHDDIAVADESFGIDFEAELAVITRDVPMGVEPGEALEHVALVALVNDVSLRNLIPGELAKGFGFVQGKPPSAFAPVAVAPSALRGWADGRLRGRLCVWRGEQRVAQADTGAGMHFHFGDLIAHAARTRPLSAGTIIGSGTVSNADAADSACCIAERRMLETLEGGEPLTPFLAYGERVRIEIFDPDGRSIFGAIDQGVTPA